MAWLNEFLHVNVLQISDQHIHMEVHNVALKAKFLFTVVYGYNDHKDRAALWEDIKRLGDHLKELG